MTTNPMLNDTIIEDAAIDSLDGTMTIAGTINKTIILLAIAVLCGAYTFNLGLSGMLDQMGMFTSIGFVGGLIFLIISRFKPQSAMPLSICYSVFEGLLLGGISFIFKEYMIDAIGITFITMLVMLCLYRFTILRATPVYYKFMMIALPSIAIYYLLIIIASAFHITAMSSLVALDNNLFLRLGICALAAFCFIGDFDRIDRYSLANKPRFFEWYFGMSLMVTIVWLYLEVLKTLGRRR